jgi:peptidoglycan/LPS O-acetylase OafA/YrhL
MMLVRKYAKAIGAVVVTVLSFISTVLNGGISPQEWVMVAGTLVSAIGVAVVPELPTGVGAWAKTIVAALGGGLTVLATSILGGLTTQEVIQVVVAALAQIGVVAVVSNKGDYKERAMAMRLEVSGSKP